MEISRPLTKRGYEVYALTGVNSLKPAEKSKGTNVTINYIYIPLRFVSFITEFLLLISIFIALPFVLLRKKIDVIIVEPGLPTVCALFWKPVISLLRCKTILDIRSTPLQRDVKDLGLRGSLVSFLFSVSVVMANKALDGITIVTPRMRDEVCAKFHIDPRSTGVWSNGVSLELFNPALIDSTCVRKKLGLEGKFVVFYHGSLGTNRGVIESVKSIQLLDERYRDIVLFLIGQGDARRSLEELVHREGLESRVIIHDQVAHGEIPQYIGMSDVCICPLPDLPDWRNQCPLKVIEYFAMGKPAILTDIPANSDVAKTSRCSIYISTSEPKEIARGIEYAYRHREQLRSWGALGLDIIQERYAWDRVVLDFERYISKL